jgi:hypothetical protein
LTHLLRAGPSILRSVSRSGALVAAEVSLSDWYRLLHGALVNGLILSLLLTTLAGMGGVVALDMFVDKYPPDIQQKHGPMSPRAARLRPYFAALFFIPVLLVPLVGLLRLQREVGPIGFWQAFAYAGVSVLVFDLFDLIILDWLLLCTLQPRFMVLPGTEGMPGYRDYRFHFIGFLKGLGFAVMASLLVAILWTVLPWLTPSS